MLWKMLWIIVLAFMAIGYTILALGLYVLRHMNLLGTIAGIVVFMYMTYCAWMFSSMTAKAWKRLNSEKKKEEIKK